MNDAKARPPASVKVVHEGPGYLFAEFRNVFVSVWAVQGTGPLVVKMREFAEEFLERHPEGVSTIQFVAKGTPLATSEARDGIVAMIKGRMERIACIGTVLEGHGFWASATRSLIIGVRLLLPRSFEMQTYESLEELVAWLPQAHEKKTGVSLNPSELTDALKAVRARLRG